MSNEQNVRPYYIEQQVYYSTTKKNCYFAVGFYYFGKSIQKHPDSVSENDVKSEQMFAHIMCQTIE